MRKWPEGVPVDPGTGIVGIVPITVGQKKPHRKVTILVHA